MNYLQQIKQDGYCIFPQVFNPEQVSELLIKVKNIYETTKDEICQDTPYLNNNQPNVYNLQNKDIHFIDTLLGIKEIENVLIDNLNDSSSVPLTFFQSS